MANSFRKGTKSVVRIEDVTKEDINFPEFCFGVIGKVPLKDQPEELIYVDKINPNAQITISRSKFGLPTQFTRDLRLALVRIAMKKNKFSSNSVNVNSTEMLEEMGLELNGRNFQDLKRHLDILTGTRIKFINSFYNKDQSSQISTTQEFSILDGYKLVEYNKLNGKRVKNDEIKIQGKFVWNSFFYENSIKNAVNLIDLDYSIYRTLEGDITKQLYSFLNKRRYNKDSLRLEIEVLAYEKLGMSRNNSLSKVRFKLKESHKNLIKFGILAKVPTFVKTPDRKEYVVYNFLPYVESRLDQDVLLIGSSEYDEIRHKFANLDFTDAQIGKLIKEYSNERLLDALKLFDVQSAKNIIKSPKKWLFACLGKGFDMEVLKEIEDKKIQEKIELDNVELENKRKNEEIEKSKEISDKIDVWIGQNTAKYFVKCRELYDELVKTNNTIYLDVIRKEVSKTAKSEVEVIMEKPAFVKMVRSKIASLI